MLLAGGLLSVSCTLTEPYQASSPAPNPATGAVASATTPKTAAQLAKEEELRKKRIKANKEAAARRAKLRNKKKSSSSSSNKNKSSSSTTSKTSSSGSSSSEPKSGTSQPVKREPVKPSSKYPTAKKIPGKDGLVFNPWTNKTVDVRGIASGTLIRDPNDGNPAHKFRVP